MQNDLWLDDVCCDASMFNDGILILFSISIGPMFTLSNIALQKTSKVNKSKSTTGAVQVEANLQEELSVRLHFTKLKCC